MAKQAFQRTVGCYTRSDRRRLECVALAQPAAPATGAMEALRAAYLQGCEDTHKAIQNEPELALMPIQDAEFGEAADDYARAALSAGGAGE